jgi:REP element-mobilizing transposase RayT
VARTARVDAAEAAHHVMIKGIERREIFLGDEDRRDFVARLERLLPEEGWRCFAWALMPNHVHLVLQSSCGGLSRLMARLDTGYALGFNRRHQRSGYLFQNRFKSRVVEDDADLMGLVIYAHRNPLVAGIVASTTELERFPWCGHGALVGSAPPRRFEAVRACLSLFAEDTALARRRVRAWMEGGEPESDRRAITSLETSSGGGAVTLDEPQQRTRRRPPADPPQRRRSGSDAQQDLEQLLGMLSEHFQIPLHALRSRWGSRQAAEARAIAIYLAIDQLNLQGRTVAAALNLSPAAVSQARRRGRSALLQTNRSDLLSQLRPRPARH